MDNPSFYTDQVIDINILDEAVVNVNVTGKSNGNYVYGIVASKGNSLVISDSKVTSNVESVGNCSAIVIDKDSTSAITIILSDVTVNSTTTGIGTTVKNYGIKSSGSVTVTGGLNFSGNTVNNLIMSLKGCNRTYGIYANQDITLKDMKLVDIDINMTNETDNSWSYGVYSLNENVNIDNCTIKMDALVTCGLDAVLTYGGSIYINNGSDINIVSEGEVYGIVSYACDVDNPIGSNLFITESNIFVNGKEGYGICIDGWDDIKDRINISNSDINIILGEEDLVGNGAFGVYNSDGNLDITKSNISMDIYAKTAYGLECYNDITLIDSKVDILINKVEANGIAILSYEGNIVCSNLIKESKISVVGNNSAYISGVESEYDGVNINGGELWIDVVGNSAQGIVAGTIYINYPNRYVDQVTDINILSAKVNITATGTTSSSIVSGIRTTNGNIELKDSDIQTSSTNITDSYGLRVNDGKTISVNGSNVFIKAGKALGISSADKLLLGSGTDTDSTSRIVKASKVFNYTESDITSYESASYSEYKYLEIAKIANYTLRYNATAGTLHKGSNTTALTSDELVALGIEIDNNKVLILKGINFKTTADKALQIDGTAKIELAEATTNYLDASYTVTNNSIFYGVYANNELTIQGLGTLNINHATSNQLEKGDDVLSYGIYDDATTEELNIYNGNINIKGNETYAYGVYAKKYINIGEEGKANDIIVNMSLKGRKVVKGIYASDNIKIYNSDIDINVAATDPTVIDDDYSCSGLFTWKSVYISENASVDINMNSEKIAADYTLANGIFANTEMNIDNSIVNVIGDIADVNGLKCQGKINIQNKSEIGVNITSDVEGSYCLGIYYLGNKGFNIEDSKINIITDNTEAYGIYSSSSIISINQSEVDIKADLAKCGIGIFGEKEINITDSPMIKINLISDGVVKENRVVGIETYQSNINITNSILDIDVQGYIGIGINAEGAKLYVNNCTTDILVKGATTTGLESNQTKPASTVLSAGAYIKIMGGNLVGEANSIYSTRGMELTGSSSVMSIEGIKIQGTERLDMSSNNGEAIYINASKPLSMVNSTCRLQGNTNVIYLDTGGTCDIRGKVQASADYLGTNKVEIIDVNNTYGNYKYLEIIPSIICVDITWGNMDFKYTEGSWNPISHDYNVGTWNPTDGNTDSTKITVDNANSNVPIYAGINYAPSSGYEGISGKIVDGAQNEISNNVRVLKGNSFVAYLDLSNKLPSTTLSKTPIGTVTVTISE